MIEFRAAIFAWPSALSDHPGEGWDAVGVNSSMGATSEKTHELCILAQGCMVDNCVCVI